jgi:hypothetical protein
MLPGSDVKRHVIDEKIGAFVFRLWLGGMGMGTKPAAISLTRVLGIRSDTELD